MSISVLPRLQPIIKAGVSGRTVKIEVVLPEREERGRAVTEVGTKEVLDYLSATNVIHGTLISGPSGLINNSHGEACACWIFEKKDLRVSHTKKKTTSNKNKSK